MKIDFNKHPYLVQFYPRPMFWFAYLETTSIEIDLMRAEIKKKWIDKRKGVMTSKVYEVRDEDMLRLLDFFSYDDINNFDNLSEEELKNLYRGYRDEGYRVEYYIYCQNHHPLRIEGSLGWFYEGNPVEDALSWVHDVIKD